MLENALQSEIVISTFNYWLQTITLLKEFLIAYSCWQEESFLYDGEGFIPAASNYSNFALFHRNWKLGSTGHNIKAIKHLHK